VELDDQHHPAFGLWDFASDPPRVLTLTESTSVDCLGDLFGGQTLRLSGSGSDSALPGQTLSIQVYLVDGGAAGQDQLSLKASQADGAVAYFVPLRSLESGDIGVSCSS
jgi:hypothetical protein